MIKLHENSEMAKKISQVLDAEKFGRRVSQIREELLDLSQTGLANEIGATQMMISRLETGAGGNINIIYNLVSYLHDQGYKAETLFLPEFKTEYLINTVDKTPTQSQSYHKLKLFKEELEERTKQDVQELSDIIYLITNQP